MTALTVPLRPAKDASLRPLPWRRMAWVSWRHHRIALGGVTVFLGALAAHPRADTPSPGHREGRQAPR
jgi:hypothetical protein